MNRYYNHCNNENYKYCKDKYCSYHRDQNYDYDKEKEKHYKEVNIGNPIVNVHVDCCNENKKKQHKKSCECSGIVNNAPRVIINICPNCQNENSSLFIETANITSTSINPPDCFTNTSGTHLVVTGTAMRVEAGVVFEGVFNAVLSELPGAFDRILLTFVGISSTGAQTSILADIPIPDANLTIRQCNSHNCSYDSFNPSLIPFANTLNNETLNKIIIINPDGQVETIKMT
ncbi:hypothetical protein MHB59_28580 [Bacillus sp. FSL L8-0642]|uniref:hypothetical protein n=1 Tax=Bacillus sp. FSL L8-0642 TaxID=2921525 RepID=UPI0030FBDDA6